MIHRPIIFQLKSGDMAAFKIVFHKYYARLTSYAIRWFMTELSPKV